MRPYITVYASLLLWWKYWTIYYTDKSSNKAVRFSKLAYEKNFQMGFTCYINNFSDTA